MPLTEEEEFELLSLERERSMSGVSNSGEPTYSTPAIPQKKDPGLVDDLKRRASNMMRNEERYASRSIPMQILRAPELALQQTGQAAGMVVDAGNRALQAVEGAAKKVIPAPVRSAVQEAWFPQTVGAENSAATKAIESGMQKVGEKWNQFAEKNPDLAADIGGAANIGMVATGAKSIPGSVRHVIPSGKGLMSAADRIQGTKVKINAPEQRAGASNQFYSKYGVFGNADKVHAQWSSKIDDVSEQIAKGLEGRAELPESQVSLQDILNQAKASARGNVDPSKLKGKKSKLEQKYTTDDINKIESDLKATYGDDLGNIDILEAQKLKQFIGKKGDWLHFNGQVAKNYDLTNQAAAHNAVYDALKKALENKGPEDLRELNKQLSEMIPMERAARKQVLVQNRKNPISLDDYVGAIAVASSAAQGNLIPGAVALANAASKSPSVAKGLYSVGKKLEDSKKSRLPPPSQTQGNAPKITAPVRPTNGPNIEVPAFQRKGINVDDLDKRIAIELAEKESKANAQKAIAAKSMREYEAKRAAERKAESDYIGTQMQKANAKAYAEKQAARKEMEFNEAKRKWTEKFIKDLNDERAKKINEAIRGMRPKVSEEQEMRDALYKYYTSRK